MQLSRVPSGLPPLVQCLSGWEPLPQQILLCCVAFIVERWLVRPCCVLIRSKKRGMSSGDGTISRQGNVYKARALQRVVQVGMGPQTLGLCGHEVP